MYSRPLFLQTPSGIRAEERQSRRSLADLLAVAVRCAPQEEPLLLIEARYLRMDMTRQHVREFAEQLRNALSLLARCASPSSLVQNQWAHSNLSLEEDIARVDAELQELAARICFLPQETSSVFPGYLRVASTVTSLTYAQAQLVEADVTCLVHDLDTDEALFFYARGSFEGAAHVQRRENRGRTAPVLCGSSIPQFPIIAYLRPGWFVTPCRGDPSKEAENVVCASCLAQMSRPA